MTRVEGWTEGRFRSFITSAIRSGFRRFPNKYVVLKNAFTGRKKNKASGRLAAHTVALHARSPSLTKRFR